MDEKTRELERLCGLARDLEDHKQRLITIESESKSLQGEMDSQRKENQHLKEMNASLHEEKSSMEKNMDSLKENVRTSSILIESLEGKITL